MVADFSLTSPLFALTDRHEHCATSMQWSARCRPLYCISLVKFLTAIDRNLIFGLVTAPSKRMRLI